MRTTLAAIASAVALAQPASAVTFPSLTTIYVGSGVRDDGGASMAGTATIFQCTNVSGVTTNVRFLILNTVGGVAASSTQELLHARSITVSTHNTVAYDENVFFGTGGPTQGAIIIESLQSGVFCNAKTIDASAIFPDGMILPLVRVNPHPGTVE